MQEKHFPPSTIWFIALWLLLGAVSVLSGVLMYYSGTISDTDRLMKLSKLGSLHWGLSITIGLFNLLGAALLLFMKRRALYFIAGAFAITVAQVLLLMKAGKLQEVFGKPPELYALPVSLSLGVVILIYIWRLAKRGDLN